MIKAIHTAKKAKRDFLDKVARFAEIEARMQRQKEKKELPEMPIEPGLDHHLVGQGLPAHFSVKNAIAKQMGIHNYTGTKEQDSLIMAGIQGRAMKEESESTKGMEKEKSEREHSFKEKELALKEKEMENRQKEVPNADDIAQSLLKSFNKN